ncbi:CHAT domain-containing protein [Streptomyces sp. NBC_00038]|uniref:CHAT domain-containing protein n=1 Tax=Streptomyces sp. NBC_00038 TaxID=2903615 RepID=UPI00225206DB|nr:CHAT domain-containing protein [Streptomyces sp. NBC_00038]MCX5561719.1 CHAT domain-containing protein [Streptomyces sp. NBC_00038]
MRRKRTKQAIEKGDALLGQGELDAAEVCYREAVDLTPDSAEALYSVGCVASHRRDFQESLVWARRALAADTGHRGSRLLAGNALLGMERYAEALDLFSGAEHADDVGTQVHIALCHEGLGELETAENELRAVLEHDPAYITRHLAVAMYDHSPFWADVHAPLARVLRRRGSDEDARLHYHLAKRIDPTVELDPGYLEIMRKEDLEDHSVDRAREATRFDDLDLSGFGDRQEDVRRLLRLAHSPDPDAFARSADAWDAEERERLLSTVVDLINATQLSGSFRLSTALRAAGDELDDGSGRDLFTAVISGPWQRLLEIAELLHAGDRTDEEARAAAARDDAPLAAPDLLLALVRRFAHIDTATALPLARVAAAALAARGSVAQGLEARVLVGRTCQLAGDPAAAEHALREAVDEAEEQGGTHGAVLLDALCLLGQVQGGRGHHARAIETMRQYAEVADRSERWDHRIRSRYNLAVALGKSGQGAAADAEAHRAAELVRAAPAEEDPGGYSDDIDRLLDWTAALTGTERETTAAVAPGPSADISVEALRDQALDLHEQGRTEEALSLLDRAGAAALDAGRRRVAGEIGLEQGAMLVALGRLGPARDALESNLPLVPESQAGERAAAYLNLAHLHGQEGRTDQALDALTRALSAAYRLGDPWIEAQVHETLGSALLEREPDAAIYHHGLALRLLGQDTAGPAEPHESSVRTRFEGLAEQARAVRADRADLLATLELMTQELAAVDFVPDRRRAALITGDTLLDLGLPDSAEQPLLDALALAAAQPWRDPESELDARSALGMAYRRTGRYGEAIDQYRAALGLTEVLRDGRRAAALHGYLAIALRYDDQLDAAVESYEKSIAMLLRFGREQEVAANRTNLAATLFLLGRREQAVELAVQNLDELIAQGNEDFVLRTLMLLATEYVSADQLPEGLSERLRAGAARSTDPTLRAWSCVDHAEQLLARGDIDGAERELERAVDVHRAGHDPFNEAMALLNRARLLHEVRPETARADADQACRIAVATGQNRLAIEAQSESLWLALARADTADIDRLLRTLTAGWAARRRALRQDRDRITLADEAVPLIKGCSEEFLRCGDPVRAFDTLDQARALALADLLAERHLPTDQAPAAEVKPSITASPTDMARALLRALDVPAVAVTLDMLAGGPVLGVLRPDASSPEFHHADLSEDETAALLDAFRVEMLDYAGSGPQTWPRGLQRLLAPVLETIRGGELVVLVPEGELQQLPLHAVRLTDGSSLIERSPVLYAPSFAALDLALRAPRPTADPLAHLVTVGVSFPDEARAISLAFGGPCLSGRNLSKGDVHRRVQGASLVHFSCHGYFDAHDFLDSGLLLRVTETPLREEILSLRDLADWQLHADLVVLSACETGQGRAVPSDFLGLARGILAAGARAVLVTLWPVHDEATQSLMLDFYRDMTRQRDATGLVDVAAALAAAQRNASRNRPPYDWAAFKLIGWPRIEWSAAVEGSGDE